MKQTFAMLALISLAAMTCGSAAAMSTDTVAQEMASLSLGHPVAAGDPAVIRTRTMLEQVSKRSGDDATAIFAACRRYAGHLRDAAQIKASQLELLAALDTHGKTGESINDTLQAYVAARKAAADKTHATAMAALARQKK
ncbi:hypothetical protein [Candidatus Accumulibacter sp. ACC007]|uniref:hypothetical protein n=1 Tax=Candidatus Accumulibacter sp. ACC007 TaxID=2823333 RepID=UPI0025BBE37D|nr:hypothetical protein [Candidatus Accumulibacter sp. ACC007]